MLKTELKASILLLVFGFLLSEYLNWATLLFIIFGTVVLYFKIEVPKLVRNLGVLGIFASYWVTYGKVIDPEVGLNFLTTVVVVKLLEKENLRDRYMIFFGLVLLFSAGSLFEKTLTYALFYGSAFLILLKDFYTDLSVKWRPRDLGVAFLWVIPLTLILFFVFPRLLNPLPFGKSGPNAGEVGFTPDVNISEVDKLTGNDTPVFQALVKASLPQDALYWRGNILSQNDGWNWRRSYGESVMSEARESSPEGISQKIRILGKEDYFFALDHPEALVYAGKMNRPIAGSSLNQRTWQWVSSYEAFSLPGGRLKASPPSEGTELQNMLSKRDQAWIQKTFPAQELSDIQDEVQRYFKDEQFVYSLAPGRITNFRAFMDRKVGFCSHYASAMALILRTKGIPTRLVSGFMGGSFNRFASYYLINQNDAHVWVEAYSDGEWRKLDPTEWIAPERVRLGGEAFMTQNSSVGLQGIARRLNLKFIQDIQFWFKQWDFKFYTFIDEMDYHGQSAWLYKLNLKRIWLYALLPIILFGFLGLHAYYSRHRKIPGEDEIYQELWRLFIKRVQKRGIQLGTVALSQQEELIEASQLRASDKDKILKVRKKLIETSFGSRSSPELRAEIRGL